ncbi:hypothetical protein [Marivita sp. GX14005]|uniref:hypothetical protein n=1 Tax=Marivita sp. GX14005 TaxID=2942276 RepID=UPI002019AE2F|nr:hypothetical protein [Marivita sp. GX14005]MCL3881220.1 hypothetical protein [Marivita sp. GX14005]
MTLALTGCLDTSPDAVELSNIRPWNVIPRSSPTAFVKTFDRLCVKPLVAKQPFETTLRNASYVPTGKRDRRGFRTFVVDDRRPAVLVQERRASRGCGVIAVARTGQTQRVRNAIPQLFPNARPANPSLVAGAEQVWVETSPTRVIFTSRDASIPSGANYRLAVIETE